MEIKQGRYYGRTWGGRLEPLGDVDAKPDAKICRRVADYAPAPIPTGAGIGTCARCGATIAFNPAGPHQDVTKICLQCAEIQPLPIE